MSCAQEELLKVVPTLPRSSALITLNVLSTWYRLRLLVNAIVKGTVIATSCDAKQQPSYYLLYIYPSQIYMVSFIKAQDPKECAPLPLEPCVRPVKT